MGNGHVRCTQSDGGMLWDKAKVCAHTGVVGTDPALLERRRLLLAESATGAGMWSI